METFSFLRLSLQFHAVVFVDAFDGGEGMIRNMITHIFKKDYFCSNFNRCNTMQNIAKSK